MHYNEFTQEFSLFHTHNRQFTVPPIAFSHENIFILAECVTLHKVFWVQDETGTLSSEISPQRILLEDWLFVLIGYFCGTAITSFFIGRSQSDQTSQIKVFVT